MAIGGVVINWASKTAGAVADTDRLAKSVGNVGDSAKRSGGALGKIGKAATAGIAGVGLVAAGAAVAFVDMAKSAYDDANAQKKLERTLGRVKGVTKKAAEATGTWIDKMELATLVSDDELRQAVGNLTLATGDLTQAQKLAALAQDASVASGKGFLPIAQAMAKAADGNTAALRKMFPFLDTGPDKVLTLAEAMDQLTAKFGGAAKAAADNDVFGRLGVAWGQIKEAIGTAALPMLDAVSKWFSDKKHIADIQGWIGQLQAWATTVGEEFVGKVREFYAWLQSPEGQQAMKDFAQGVKDIADAIGDAYDAIKNLAGYLDTPAGRLALKFFGWIHGIGGIDPLSGPARTFRPGHSTKEDYDKADQMTGHEGFGGPRQTSSSKGATVVNIYNPKPERATTSTAAALRVSRPNTVSV